MTAPVLSQAPARRSGVRGGSRPASSTRTGLRRSGRPSRRTGQRHSTRRRWRLSKLSLIPALIMVLGLSAITYPHAAQWTTQLHQSDIVSGYAGAVAEARPEAEVQLTNAEAYNEALTGGAIYEAGSNVPTTTDSFHESTDASILPYDQQLHAGDNGLMARLRIPKIKLDLPVFHGTSDETLLKGLGHLRGTALPVGGAGMRPVITGHRGLAEAEMFTRLDELTEGDTFTIETFGRVLTYRVFEKIVVKPDEQKAFLAEPGRDLVTLVTCTPLGINTHRILITGERIIPTPDKDLAQAGQAPDIPGFPWWLVLYLAGLAGVGVYVWWAGLPPKRRQGKDAADADDAAARPGPRGAAGRVVRSGSAGPGAGRLALSRAGRRRGSR